MAETWDEGRRADQISGAIDLAMRFSDAGLVLGAETILAPAGASARDIAVDVTDPRLLALLAAAHLRRPAPIDLAHIGKAADRWRTGDDALAAMHLALSRLNRLAHPVADARRLFLANGLLEAGFRADAIIKALDLDATSSGQVAKYSPDQPRVPAGSGGTSGEWTTAVEPSPATAPSADGERNALVESVSNSRRQSSARLLRPISVRSARPSGRWPTQLRSQIPSQSGVNWGRKARSPSPPRWKPGDGSYWVSRLLFGLRWDSESKMCSSTFRSVPRATPRRTTGSLR